MKIIDSHLRFTKIIRKYIGIFWFSRIVSGGESMIFPPGGGGGVSWQEVPQRRRVGGPPREFGI